LIPAHNVRLFGCVFLLAAAVLIPSTAPTIYWGDDGYLITSSLKLGLGHPPGHPVYGLLERIICWIPLGDAAHRFNVFSAINLSIVIALLMVWFRHLKIRPISGYIGGLTTCVLLISSTFFRHQAVRAETYALHTLLLTMIFLLLSWDTHGNRKWAGVFLSGILMGNQLLLAAFAFPGLLILYFHGTDRKQWIRNSSIALLFMMLGGSVYLYVPLRSQSSPDVLYNTAHTAPGFLDYATARDYQHQFYARANGGVNYRDHLRELLIERESIFLLPVLVMVIGGCIIGMKLYRPETLCLLLVSIVTVAGSISCKTFSVENWDFQGYLLPMIVSFAVLAGLFFSVVSHRLYSFRVVQVSLLITACIPLGVLPVRIQETTLEDHSFARLFGLTYLDDAPGRTIVIMRSDLFYVLTYLRHVEKFRDDCDVLSANQILRIRDSDLLNDMYDTVSFTDPEFMNDATWMQRIILSNSRIRPVRVELSDVDDFLPYPPDDLNGSTILFGDYPDRHAPGRTILFFKKWTDQGQQLHSDHNAVEQVSTIFYNRGTFYLKRERLRQAFRELSFAARLDPWRANIFNNLGVTMAEMDLQEDAVRCFHHAVTINPFHKRAAENLKMLIGHK
jgi:Protein O-mannosyl-transferase TMEM260-like